MLDTLQKSDNMKKEKKKSERENTIKWTNEYTNIRFDEKNKNDLKYEILSSGWKKESLLFEHVETLIRVSVLH